MPVDPADVTLGAMPTVDAVHDRIAARFASGASLTVTHAGVVELLSEQPPTEDEIAMLAELLIDAGDRREAVAVLRWVA